MREAKENQEGVIARRTSKRYKDKERDMKVHLNLLYYPPTPRNCNLMVYTLGFHNAMIHGLSNTEYAEFRDQSASCIAYFCDQYLFGIWTTE